MSDRIRDSFTQFYAAIEKSYEALKGDRVKIEDRKTGMLELLKSGVTVPNPPSGTGEYQELCRTVMDNARLQLESWQTLIQQKIDKSEFVNRHEKSILALVFADVNAGKSSLGNFVGGWNFRDTAYADLYQPHDCEVEEFSKASREDRQVRVIDHFPENATEATSTIQHYTLAQGLTWVDTPGLHSLTVEHGELAQEYIQFADLVIYLTPSSSPFKKDEREMLEKLFKMGKPVILAITKSDFTPPPAYRDGKMVRLPLAPKSAENRRAQEKYIAEQIREIRGNDNLENSHVLSLSVKLARNAVKTGDSDLYAASNLDGFLAQVGDILSEKAVELKMRRPRAEVNAFIDTLTGRSDAGWQDMLTIPQLRADLAEKSENLQKVLETCKAEEAKICAEVELQLPTVLSLAFRSLRDRKSLDNAETVKAEMSERISKLVAECCRKGLEQLGGMVFTLELPPIRVASADGRGYQVQHMEQIIAQNVERDPRGVEHIIRFFDRDRKFYRVETRRERIPTGDNFQAFLDKQLEDVRAEVRDHVAKTMERIAGECIGPLLECYQELDRQLAALTEKLDQLRF